jgi:hypothetical protein
MGWTDGFAELELAANECGDGRALGGRVMLTRQQHKGVSHVSIASAYDRGHEVGETVSSYSRLCEEEVRAYLLKMREHGAARGTSRPTRMAEPWGGGAEVPGLPRFRFHSPR